MYIIGKLVMFQGNVSAKKMGFQLDLLPFLGFPCWVNFGGGYGCRPIAGWYLLGTGEVHA